MMHRTKPGRRTRRPAVEGLEDRRLLAATVLNYPVASATTVINGVAAYPDGNIWFTASNPAEIGVLHPATGFSLLFPLGITGSAPQGIAVGQDGNVYFTDSGTSSIGVFNPATLKFVELPTPSAGSRPTAIATANGGTIWFTESGVGKIGQYDPATQTMGEFPLSAFNINPNYIQVGPGGVLWFEQFGSFGSIDPATKAISSVSYGSNVPVGGFAFNAAGNIQYVTSVNATSSGGQYAAAQLVPGTGVVTVASPSATFTSAGPFPKQLVTGSDGNIYFAQTPPGVGPTVGELNVATQALARYTGSASSSPAVETSIVSAPGGTLFVGSLGVIGQATIVPTTQGAISGQVTEAAHPPGSGPRIAGRTVFVDLHNDGTFDPGDPSAVSDAAGNYTIPAVPIGTFNVRIVPFPGDFTNPTLIAIAGGNVVQNVALFLQPSQSMLALTLSSNPFGTANPNVATAEVTGLYNIILNRAPDASGLAFYTNYLTGGGSVGVVAENLLHSTEYETNLVASYYVNYLGRVGTPAEIAAWVSLFQAGNSAEQVTSLMLSSAAFSSLFPTNASFIQALYGDILGRQATAAEVSGWEAYLVKGSRASFVNFIIHSPEAGIRAAKGFYAVFWASPIDIQGEANVVNALANGATLTDVASLFAVSPQYVTRAQATVG